MDMAIFDRITFSFKCWLILRGVDTLRAERLGGNGGELETYGLFCIAKALNALEIVSVRQERGM
jgi:hypothetical protein